MNLLAAAALFLLAQETIPTPDDAPKGFLNNFNQTDLLLIGGILLITLALFQFLRKRQRAASGSDAKTTANEQIERNRQLRGVRNDMETLMVEIEEFARRIGNQLDAKAVRLEKLIDEADLKLTQLEQRSTPHTPASAPPLGPAPAASTPGSPNAATPLPHEAATDPLAQSVHTLADQGKEAHEIARELGEHVGKVELILALRKV